MNVLEIINVFEFVDIYDVVEYRKYTDIYIEKYLPMVAKIQPLMKWLQMRELVKLRLLLDTNTDHPLYERLMEIFDNNLKK